MKFSELDKDDKILVSTLPQCVYVTKNPDEETYEQVMERQEKFLELPENVKDKLVSHETAKKIQRIGKHHNLELLQMASIARLVRNYYFREVKEDVFSDVLVREIGIDLRSANEIAKYVIERIINTEVKNETLENKSIKMILIQAMEKYPNIQGQLVSEELIKIESQINPVKGSIKNWIKDYFAVVGAGNRDVMKRSSYLYHSQNTKTLSVEEKQKLSFIIKALEDNTTVMVDLLKEEVIFPTNGDRESKKRKIKEVINKNEIKHKKKKEIVFDRARGGEKVIADENSVGKINHIKGNNFNLKSDHFEIDKKEDNIKFSTPQQFPVEKKLNKDNNFGRIKPVEKV